MHITEDYVELGSISESLMNPVTKILEETDWNGPEYDRNEVSLQGGKLLVLPYIIPFKKPSYTTAQVKLLQTVSPIIEHIMIFFPNYVKVRGELATLLPGEKFDCITMIDGSMKIADAYMFQLLQITRLNSTLRIGNII
jgi:hypothetical protein